MFGIVCYCNPIHLSLHLSALTTNHDIGSGVTRPL
ncbi:hypothetical protein PC128_g4651 [Phytophthora cactorum]|nr:hypothetical protein PC128_g4651 [Phytophthora cactorum]